MKYVVTIFLFLGNGMVIHAQNLVPNGSFEIYSSCPDNTNQGDSLQEWISLLNTPDYYNSCTSTWFVDVPDNFTGSQYPFEGNGYIGLFTFEVDPNYREIMGCNLLDTLKVGNHYIVSMRVSRADASPNNAGSNGLGFRFSTFPYSASNPPMIDNYSQLYCDTIITDSTSWILLSYEYVPDSSYSFLSIGNFFDDVQTDTIAIGDFPWRAYYYIDSVSITCEDKDCYNTSISPVDSDKGFYFSNETNILNNPFSSFEQVQLLIYNSVGQLVKNIPDLSSSQINLSHLNMGTYYAYLKTQHATYLKKILIIHSNN